MTQGKLIVFEGIDGSGKSTQIELLSKQLDNSVVLRPLSSEPIGPQIDSIVKRFKPKGKTEALLYATTRRFTHDEYIVPYLTWKNVICDRYLMDGFAYSCNRLTDLLDGFVIDINQELTKPDITFLLDIDPEVSLVRIKGPMDHFEKVDFLKAVREKYLELVSDSFDLDDWIEIYKDQNWIVLDGSQSVEVLQSQIWEEVQKIM